MAEPQPPRTSSSPSVGACTVCGVELGLLDRGARQTCRSLKCTTALAVRADGERRQARRIDLAAALAWFVENGREAPDPIRVGAVPSFDSALVPSDPARVELLRAALEDGVARAVAATEPRPGEDIGVEPVTGPVLGAACGTCRGYCCSGGGTHAFLTAQELARQLEKRPGITADALVASYLAAIPDRSYEGSCVFHGEHGCTLPRTERAAICNWWLCKGAAEWAAAIEDAPGEPAFVAAVETGTVRRGTVVPGRREPPGPLRGGTQIVAVGRPLRYISRMASRTVARIAPGLVVLHDHARLPSRFFGRFTAGILADLRRSF